MDRRAWFFLACLVLVPWQLYHVSTHPQFYRPPLPIGDGPDYDTIGYSLSTGRGFAFAWNDAQWKAPYLKDASAGEYSHLHRDARSGTTTSRPPLVPLVLAAIYRILGHDATSFAVFRCLSAFAIGLAGSIAVGIAFDVGTKLGQNRWTSHFAAAAALGFAFFDSTIRTYAIDFLSEPLALLWTTLLLWIGLNLTCDRLRASPTDRLELRHIDKQGLGATGFASADDDLLGCTNTGKASGTPVVLCDKALVKSDAKVAEKGHRDDTVRLIANHLPVRFPLFRYRLMNYVPVLLLAVCMAAMVATRSMFVFWTPGIALILFLTLPHSPRLATFVFVASVMFLLCPWWIRNCQRLDAFMPMGAQGAASILGGYSDEALADQGNWHPDSQDRLQARLLDQPIASNWSNLELEKRMAEAASIETRQWIRQHARELPRLVGLRLKTHWGPYFGKSMIWRVGMLLGAIALLYHRRSEAYWLLGIPVLSSITVMCLYETGGRFLVPLYGLLYSLAGVGVAFVASSVIARRHGLSLPTSSHS